MGSPDDGTKAPAADAGTDGLTDKMANLTVNDATTAASIPGLSVSKEGGTSFITNYSAGKDCIVCVGPSGAGKSTLIKRLQDEAPGAFGFSVSNTTRAPREGEEDGVHYNFLTKEVMEKKISDNEMIEYAHVHSNIYGTSFEGVNKVIANKQRCILDIDVQGADLIKKSSLNEKTAYIFISPPDMKTLEERLRSRGTETEERIQTRLKNAAGEMEYKGKENFWDAVLVNDDLEKAYAVFKEFMLGKKEG